MVTTSGDIGQRTFTVSLRHYYRHKIQIKSIWFSGDMITRSTLGGHYHADSFSILYLAQVK